MGTASKVGLGVIAAFALFTWPDAVIPLFVVVVFGWVFVRGQLRKRGVLR